MYDLHMEAYIDFKLKYYCIFPTLISLTLDKSF